MTITQGQYHVHWTFQFKHNMQMSGYWDRKNSQNHTRPQNEQKIALWEAASNQHQCSNRVHCKSIGFAPGGCTRSLWTWPTSNVEEEQRNGGEGKPGAYRGWRTVRQGRFLWRRRSAGDLGRRCCRFGLALAAGKLRRWWAGTVPPAAGLLCAGLLFDAAVLGLDVVALAS
jgi:hypothetical protein